MTREEAINLLGWLKSKTNREDDLEAIDMVIEVLSEPSGDLISRADVLEGLKHSTAYLHDDIYTIVNRIPSAEITGALDDAIAKYVADGLMELPSAEAVQVVQCKDCRYYGCGVDICESLGDDGFCSWGERRGGDDE